MKNKVVSKLVCLNRFFIHVQITNKKGRNMKRMNLNMTAKTKNYMIGLGQVFNDPTTNQS